MILPIVKLGEDILRQKSQPVPEVTDEIRKLCQDMFETMDAADGVGLAAPQIGLPLRMFVLTADDNVRRVFINPQIIATSEELGDYDEVWKEELEFPYEYQYENCRFLQWPGGRHWYVKIGSIDIGDDWGNYKFSDLSYAQEVAKKWCQCGGDWDVYDKIHENEEHTRESKKYHREHKN